MPKKKNKEEILALKRELERRRYERIKNNPELYIRYKEISKEKYKGLKQQRKVKNIKKITKEIKC